MEKRCRTDSEPVTVAVFGHVGQHNLGDEAAFDVVIKAVRARRSAVEIIGISVRPEDTRQRYGIPTFPIWRDVPSLTSVPDSIGGSQSGAHAVPKTSVNQASPLKQAVKAIPGLASLFRFGWRALRLTLTSGREAAFLWRSYRMLRQVDLLAVAGSQHLNDYIVGPWNFPYTVFKWTAIAKLAGAKVAFINVGAGPLQTSLGRWFVRQAVAWSDFQSYRDESSVRCIQELGLNVSSPSVPDMVFSLFREKSRPSADPSRRSMVVGINPIPFNSADYWVGASEEKYQRYIRTMVEFVQWLLRRGHKVVFFPTQLSLDTKVIKNVRDALDPKLVNVESVAEASIKSIEDLSATLAGMDLVVASRFHGAIFSMLLEKPVLGIAYAEKTRDLMAYMGQGEYVMDITKLDLQEMQRMFQVIETRQTEIQAVLRTRLQEAKRRVEAQFDAVLGLLGPITTH